MIYKKNMVDQKALLAIRSDYEILRKVFKIRNGVFYFYFILQNSEIFV